MESIELFDGTGSSRGVLDLGFNMADRAVSPCAFATAVRVLRQNGRQGTVGVKTRGEVSFSNKKPWRQKGTGRARAGTPRSPLWRKGGVVFGPTPRKSLLKIPHQTHKAVMNGLFLDVVQAKKMHSIDFVLHSGEVPSVKKARESLAQCNLLGMKVTLFVDVGDVSTCMSFRNLAHVSLVCFDQPNAVNLSKNAHWVFLEKDKDLFKEMVKKWN